jgi:hypothetical protein
MLKGVVCIIRVVLETVKRLILGAESSQVCADSIDAACGCNPMNVMQAVKFI